MDVIIETGERQFTILHQVDSVIGIKKKIQKHHGYPVSTQSLVFMNQTLNDEVDVEILRGSKIQLIINHHQQQQEEEDLVPKMESLTINSEESSTRLVLLSVYSRIAKTLTTVEADPTDSVVKIKERIQTTVGYCWDWMPLCDRDDGEPLQDHRALADYGVSDGTMLRVATEWLSHYLEFEDEPIVKAKQVHRRPTGDISFNGYVGEQDRRTLPEWG